MRAGARTLTPPLAVSGTLTRTLPLHLARAVDRRDALTEGGLVHVVGLARVRVRARARVRVRVSSRSLTHACRPVVAAATRGV